MTWLRKGTTMASHKRITDKEVLDYMIRAGKPVIMLPTVDNVSQAFGISKSTTQHHINNLVRDGYLRRGKGPRPIELP